MDLCSPPPLLPPPRFGVCFVPNGSAVTVRRWIHPSSPPATAAQDEQVRLRAQVTFAMSTPGR